MSLLVLIGGSSGAINPEIVTGVSISRTNLIMIGISVSPRNYIDPTSSIA